MRYSERFGSWPLCWAKTLAGWTPLKEMCIWITRGPLRLGSWMVFALLYPSCWGIRVENSSLILRQFLVVNRSPPWLGHWYLVGVGVRTLSLFEGFSASSSCFLVWLGSHLGGGNLYFIRYNWLRVDCWLGSPFFKKNRCSAINAENVSTPPSGHRFRFSSK